LLFHVYIQTDAIIQAYVSETNDESKRLLAKAGFEVVGILPKIGEKFGRRLSDELWQISLVPFIGDEGDTEL